MYDPIEVHQHLMEIAAKPAGDILLALVLATIDEAEAARTEGVAATASIPLAGMATKPSILRTIGYSIPILRMIIQAREAAGWTKQPLIQRELTEFGNDRETARIMEAAVTWCAETFAIDAEDEVGLRYHYDWVCGLVDNDPASRTFTRELTADVDLDLARIELPDRALQRLAPDEREDERVRRDDERFRQEKYGTPPPGMTWNV